MIIIQGAVLLLLSAVVVSEDEPAEISNECKTWPSNLRSLQECCNVPYHSNSVLQSICQTKCFVVAKDSQYECVVDCYINMTGLIKDGTVNKLVVKRIYENNIYNERSWIKVISEGVEKCEYPTNGSKIEKLVGFYNCVNDFLAENCKDFIQSSECQDTEEQFEKCREIKPNCTVWPTNMIHPESCCKIPVLITERMASKCRLNCQRKELFMTQQADCIQNCSYVESGLMLNGKFDFATVKKLLVENSNSSEAWTKPIDDAIEVCEKSIKGSYIDDNKRF